MSFTKTTYILVSAGGALSAAIGFVAGRYLLIKELEVKYAELSDKEIEEAKQYYSRLYKKDDFADPVELLNRSQTEEELADKLIEKLEYKATETDGILTPDDLEMAALLVEIEVAKEHGHPYLITREDYMTNELEHTQVTFTYFEEDDVLVDAEDVMIGEVENVIGVDYLGKFGVLSGDNNVLYIRNIEREIDFEIIRNKGNYARDVLGFIEHSEHTKVRKFRREYE